MFWKLIEPITLKSFRTTGLSLSCRPKKSYWAKELKKKTFSEVDILSCAKFAMERSYVGAHLSDLFCGLIEKDPNLQKIYREIEMPTSRVLFRMEQNGVLIDKQLLAKQNSGTSSKSIRTFKEKQRLLPERNLIWLVRNNSERFF